MHPTPKIDEFATFIDKLKKTFRKFLIFKKSTKFRQMAFIDFLLRLLKMIALYSDHDQKRL